MELEWHKSGNFSWIIASWNCPNELLLSFLSLTIQNQLSDSHKPSNARKALEVAIQCKVTRSFNTSRIVFNNSNDWFVTKRCFSPFLLQSYQVVIIAGQSQLAIRSRVRVKVKVISRFMTPAWVLLHFSEAVFYIFEISFPFFSVSVRF